MLFLISIPYLAYFLILKDDDEVEGLKETKLWFKIVMSVFTIGFFLLVIYEFIIDSKFSSFTFFVITIGFLLVLKFNKLLFESYLNEHLNKLIVNILFYIIMTILVSNLINVISVFHNTYFLPSNLKNIDNLECYLDKKSNEFDILYFNDKYIFVDINNSRKYKQGDIRKKTKKI